MSMVAGLFIHNLESLMITKIRECVWDYDFRLTMQCCYLLAHNDCLVSRLKIIPTQLTLFITDKIIRSLYNVEKLMRKPS